MNAKKQSTKKARFFFVRIGNADVRVKGHDRKEAARNAKAGKGRIVGVFFN